jgi:hypothetical protein
MTTLIFSLANKPFFLRRHHSADVLVSICHTCLVRDMYPDASPNGQACLCCSIPLLRETSNLNLGEYKETIILGSARFFHAELSYFNESSPSATLWQWDAKLTASVQDEITYICHKFQDEKYDFVGTMKKIMHCLRSLEAIQLTILYQTRLAMNEGAVPSFVEVGDKLRYEGGRLFRCILKGGNTLSASLVSLSRVQEDIGHLGKDIYNQISANGIFNQLPPLASIINITTALKSTYPRIIANVKASAPSIRRPETAWADVNYQMDELFGNRPFDLPLKTQILHGIENCLNELTSQNQDPSIAPICSWVVHIRCLDAKRRVLLSTLKDTLCLLLLHLRWYYTTTVFYNAKKDIEMLRKKDASVPPKKRRVLQ